MGRDCLRAITALFVTEGQGNAPMDLGGHGQFGASGASVRDTPAARTGTALLATAWSALASSRVESITIEDVVMIRHIPRGGKA
jgi:hypothetical protein